MKDGETLGAAFLNCPRTGISDSSPALAGRNVHKWGQRYIDVDVSEGRPQEEIRSGSALSVH